MKYLFSLLFIINFSTSASENSDLISVDAFKADALQAYAELKQSHVNLFSNISENDYDQHLFELLRRNSQPITPLQANIELQKFVALGKVAHARIDFLGKYFQQYRDEGGKAFPIYVQFENLRWLVTENYSDQDIAKGDEIVRINNVDAKDLFSELRNYISADTDAIAASLLEFQLPQYLWLRDTDVGQTTDAYNIVVKRKGKKRSFIVQGKTYEQLQKKIQQAKNASSETASKSMREHKLLKNNVAYLKPGPFYYVESPSNPWDTEAFHTFVDQSFQAFLAANANHLIIDLRDNPGGDNSFSDHMVAWYADKPFRFAEKFMVKSSPAAKAENDKRMSLNPEQVSATALELDQGYKKTPHGDIFELEIPKHEPRAGRQFEGQVYVLIDRHSYSNAASVAAITQDYGFGQVIGEATTDFATTYGAMESFKLNNTGIVIGFPKALIIRPSGETTPGPVVPDVILTDSTEPKELVDDPVLSQALALISKNNVTSK